VGDHDEELPACPDMKVETRALTNGSGHWSDLLQRSYEHNNPPSLGTCCAEEERKRPTSDERSHDALKQPCCMLGKPRKTFHGSYDEGGDGHGALSCWPTKGLGQIQSEEERGVLWMTCRMHRQLGGGDR
jgi:hypothetical protein